MERAKREGKKVPFSQKLRERGFFRPYVVVSFGCVPFGIVVYVLSRCFPAFAEFWARYPSQALRFLLAKITGILRFSFVEWVILSLPLLIFGYFFFSSRSMKRDESLYNYYRWLLPLVCGILAVLTLFFTAFAPCYFRYPLAQNLSLEDREVSAQELYDTACAVCEQIEDVEGEVSFVYGGESVMPYDFNELVDRVNQAYARYAADADYVSHFRSYAKPLASSSVFTYTHISGVYTFMTGEVNINVNYPDFVRPFTVAHEFSHQRGLAKEEEANFVAYLVCIGSEDPYLRYSGYVNLLQYLMDALAEADDTLYQELCAEKIPFSVQGELQAYSVFFRKYSHSTASKVTGAVNDVFLNSQGESEGTASYGLVVDLAVAYYLRENE